MFRFTDTTAHHFRPGMIFLGRDPQTGHDIGIKTERAAITIAGAGAGKNAALQIPNLLRWTENALVIDPSGGNVEVTWQAIEEMGQQVAVLDPFRVAKVPDRLRVGCNLLASIDPASLTAREDIRVIADGLVMRHDPKHGDWADARVDVIAGVIAQVVSKAPPEHRTLADVRACLTLPADAGKDEVSQLEAFFTMMRENPSCGGLARHGGNVGLSSLKSKGGDGPISKAVPGAATDTKWIDSPAMESVLVGDFDLASLKTGKVTVFLVLPPQYLDEHGRFLRLFVLAALQAMMKGGVGGRTCLFMLDEFFSLGYMQIVEKAAGLMRKYGVILWPFLQDLGQLIKLYDPNGASTFFGNSDAHIFFGNTDMPTLEHVSARLGTIKVEDTGATPVQAPVQSFDIFNGQPNNTWNAVANALYQTQQNHYQHALRSVGAPRLTPHDIRQIVGKTEGVVANAMIVFGKGGDVFILALAPYFMRFAPPVPRNPVSIPNILAENSDFIRGVQEFVWYMMAGYGASLIFHTSVFFMAYRQLGVFDNYQSLIKHFFQNSPPFVLWSIAIGTVLFAIKYFVISYFPQKRVSYIAANFFQPELLVWPVLAAWAVLCFVGAVLNKFDLAPVTAGIALCALLARAYGQASRRADLIMRIKAENLALSQERRDGEQSLEPVN